MPGRTITERELGPAALAYLKEQLSWGGLLASLLRGKDLSGGHVWAFLPVDLDDERAHDFRGACLFPENETRTVELAGGGYMVPVPKSMLGHLATFVDRFLLSAKNGICIVEEPFLSRSDPLSPRRKELPHFSCEQNVYFFARAEDALMQDHVDVLREPPTTKYLGVLADVPADQTIESGTVVPREWLDTVVSATHTIFVGAYDGEGYVFWSGP